MSRMRASRLPLGVLLAALLLLAVLAAPGCAVPGRSAGHIVDIEGTPLDVGPPPGFVLHPEGSYVYGYFRRNTDIRKRILALYSREPSGEPFPANHVALLIPSDSDDEVHDQEFLDGVRELWVKDVQEKVGTWVTLFDGPEQISSHEDPIPYKIEVMYGSFVDRDRLLTRNWVEYSRYGTLDGKYVIAISGSETFLFLKGKMITCEATLYDPGNPWRKEVVEDSRAIAAYIMSRNP